MTVLAGPADQADLDEAEAEPTDRPVSPRRQTALALLVVVTGILLANLLPLTSIVDPNPLNDRAGLGFTYGDGWLPGDRTIDPNDGFLSQATANEAADQWLAGEVPYWNHYEGLGTPLAGGMQSAAFFLPFVLLLRLANGLLYFHVCLQVLAAVGTYLLLRRLRTGQVAAVAGGIAFGVCGTFVWLQNAVMNPIAFLPWLVLGIELVIGAADEDPSPVRRWRGVVVMALALAGSLYAGFPEVAYLDALLAYSWGLLRLLQRRGDWVRRLGALALGSLAGLALAAPVLVAFASYLPDASTGGHEGQFANGSLQLLGLPAVVLPYVYGPIFGFSAHHPTEALHLWWANVGGYLPMAAVALCLVGVLGRRERALKVFLVAWSLVAGAKMFGLPVVSPLINLIPAIKLAAFYRYAPVMIELAVVVVAALTIDDLVRGDVSRRRVLVAGAAALAIVAVSALGAKGHVTVLSGAPAHEWWAALSVLAAAGVVAVVVGAGVLPTRRGRLRAGLLGGVLVLEAMVLFAVPQLSTRHDVVVDLAPVGFLQERLGTAAFATLGPIAPNYGTYFKLRAVNVNDLPVPARYTELIEVRLNRNTPAEVFTGTVMTDPAGPSNKDELLTNLGAYREIGVRYVVAPKGALSPEEAARAELVVAFADDHVEIFELSRWKPYWEPAPDSGCTVDAGDFAAVVVQCPAPTSLVRRELALPGWGATVNGREVEVSSRDDGLFQVVPLPAGRSTVAMTYRPPFATVSWLLLVAGILVLVVSAPPIWHRLAHKVDTR